MSTFKQIKQLFQANFANVIKNQTKLFLTNVDKDVLWATYLSSFPIEDQQEHNCNCCRGFIKNYGNLVAIRDNKLVSVWDFKTNDTTWQTVVDNLRNLVISAPIKEVFVTKESKLGTDWNYDLRPDKPHTKWEHFFLPLPGQFVSNSRYSIESVQGEYRDRKNVFKRGLDELTIEATETVLELIAQNSLYRGAEFKGILEAFLKIQREYAALPHNERDTFCWDNAGLAAISKIRNSSIGTLLIDISADEDLDVAVRKFEAVVAPTNYKRPNPIISKKMIEDAERTIAELGLSDSLMRRFATSDDITVNNVLFVDRHKQLTSGIFDQLKEDIVVNPRSFSKVETISINDFVSNLLPKATSIELLLENKHEPNLVSLIAPVNLDAPHLFKWNNNFTWSYRNALADSMKERVKAAGGKVDGVLRFSIQWNDKGDNNIDFDAHCIEPNGNEISFRRKTGHYSTGELDVDIISPSGKVAVENITWSNINRMQEGKYVFFVNNFSSSMSNGGFNAEIEYEGEVYSFNYPTNLRGKDDVIVAELNLSKANGITIIKSLDANTAVNSKQVWNLNTNKFYKVNMITTSPNYWDGDGIGNKHFFFILEGANNDDINVRGFFNEFLKEELMQHKRVFEALGSKIKVQPSDKQLSGLGFSTTQRNELICKVTGSFNRVVKVVF